MPSVTVMHMTIMAASLSPLNTVSVFAGCGESPDDACDIKNDVNEEGVD